MIETFISVFCDVCVALIPLIPYVLGLWLIIDIISGLIFREN